VQGLLGGVVEAGKELVENVVVSLSLVGLKEAGLLEEEMLRVGPAESIGLIVTELDVLPEAGGVVIAEGLGVSEGCEGGGGG
jgi:hypothetical protein